MHAYLDQGKLQAQARVRFTGSHRRVTTLIECDVDRQNKLDCTLQLRVTIGSYGVLSVFLTTNLSSWSPLRDSITSPLGTPTRTLLSEIL